MTSLISSFCLLVLGGIVALLLVLDAAGLWALVTGYFELRRRLSSTSNDFASVLLKSPLVPGVSVIDTPPTASPEARARLRGLLDLHFAKHEVVLVLDGPAPDELAVWIEEFHLTPVERSRHKLVPAAEVRGLYCSRDPVKLMVVEKERGGEADALNAGVNAAQYPVLGLVNRDAEFIPELLLHLVRPMLEDPDGVFGVCAMAPPAPSPGLGGYVGAIESVRLWLVRCAAFSAWNHLMPVPGSSCLLRRDVVVEAGGFRGAADSVFAQIYSSPPSGLGARAAFVARRVSWPAALQSWSELRRRAQSDQRRLAGLLQRYGWSAGITTRGLFVARILRPLLETIALLLAGVGLALGWFGWPMAGLVLVASVGFGFVLSMTAAVLREFADPSIREPAQLAALFLAAIPENLGYRQVRNLWLIAASFGGK